MAMNQDEFWRTLNGCVLPVGEMTEDHVRNALRHVIFRTRYTQLLREMLEMQNYSDKELDDAELLSRYIFGELN